MQTFVTWMMLLVIVQSLALREGFIHRFGLMCFLIGLTTLPYMQFDADAGGTQRLRLIVASAFQIRMTSVRGLVSARCTSSPWRLKADVSRSASWQRSAVSPPPCVGGHGESRPFALCGDRDHHRLPPFAQAGLSASYHSVRDVQLAYALGVFDQLVEYYLARSDVDSGRLSTWPLMLERIWATPFIGVGVSNVETWVPRMGTGSRRTTRFSSWPSSSGVLPFLFFAGMWSGRLRTTLAGFAHRAIAPEQPFRPPLLCYVLLSCLTLDFPFMSPWAVAALSIASLDSPRRLFLGRYGSLPASP